MPGRLRGRGGGCPEPAADRRDEARDREREGRLADAVRTGDAERVAGAHREVEPAHHDHGRIAAHGEPRGIEQHGTGRTGLVVGQQPAARQPDAVACELRRSIGEHGIGRPVGHDAARGAEHDDPVDHGQPGVDAVLDHDEGCPGLAGDAVDGVAHLTHPDRVEVRGRFVEQQQAGSHGERTGQREALLLPAREVRGRVVERQVEADCVERLAHTGPDLVAGHADVLASECHVVADPGQHDLRVGVLQHERRRAGRSGRASDEQRPVRVALLLAAQHPGEAVQQGGLARARGAEQQHALPRVDVEVEVVDRPGAAAGVPPPPAGGSHRGRGGGT
ncbi:hypothetical protein GCM10025877_01120 [Agromyces mangrovi Wang et al. 2018]|nr:hypothetical protein GCM10025877_01120 [Agromyces mangrovi]